MSLKTNNSLEYKNTELLTTLKANFNGKLGLARIRLICLFIVALCKVKSVNFSKVSTGFDNCAETSSNYRRIQRFISSVDLKLEWISRLIFALIPTQESYVLVMDRTNWKFGKQDINILMLGISYKNMCFPILFKMLDKRGNSNTNERKELINTFIDWFGKDCINCVLADREFVGEDWISYLNDKQIKYYIRIRNNFKVYLYSKQKEMSGFSSF